MNKLLLLLLSLSATWTLADYYTPEIGHFLATAMRVPRWGEWTRCESNKTRVCTVCTKLRICWLHVQYYTETALTHVFNPSTDTRNPVVWLHLRRYCQYINHTSGHRYSHHRLSACSVQPSYTRDASRVEMGKNPHLLCSVLFGFYEYQGSVRFGSGSCQFFKWRVLALFGFYNYNGSVRVRVLLGNVRFKL